MDPQREAVAAVAKMAKQNMVDTTLIMTFATLQNRLEETVETYLVVLPAGAPAYHTSPLFTVSSLLFSFSFFFFLHLLSSAIDDNKGILLYFIIIIYWPFFIVNNDKILY